MALQDIIKYIEDNRDRYPVDFLIGELRKNGYPESEISVALERLKGAPVAAKEERYKLFSWLAGFFGEGIISVFVGIALMSFRVGFQDVPIIYASTIVAGPAVLTAIYYSYILKLERKFLARGYFTALFLSYIISVIHIFTYSLFY